MNIELLKRIKKAILAAPKNVDMGQWTYDNPSCGTTGCIAGWANMLTTSPKMALDMNAYGQAEDAAKLFLRLSPPEALKLFFVGNWPDDLRDAYTNANVRTRAAARVIAKRIDRFIESGGTE